MKHLIIALLLAFSMQAVAQTPALNLVEKYAGEEGFTTVSISPTLFKMMAGSMDKESEEYKSLKDVASRIETFKILISDETANKGKGFGNDLAKLASSLNSKNGYEELLSVQESKNDLVKIVVKENKDRIEEMILSVVGGDENVLIVLSGDFSMQELMGIAEDMEIQGFENLQ